MTTLHKLTSLQVKNLPKGKYNDGGGLWLSKGENGKGKWVYRFTIHGVRREMGLGSSSEVLLKDARKSVSEWRDVLRGGKDPIKERARRLREASQPEATLEFVAREAFKAKQASLKNGGKAGRWMSPIELHVLPKLGKIPVTEIDQSDVKRVLEPLWHTKPDTARKTASRLNYIIKYAAASKLNVDLGAVDSAKLLLGDRNHVAENIVAMDWPEVPAFYQSLEDYSVPHLALRLLILTGVRCRPLRHAKLDQIEGQIWTIPGENMKGRKDKTPDFRVPLSGESLKVISLASANERHGYLFPGQSRGVVSDTAMRKILKQWKHPAGLHGFRSSIRTWIDDTSDTRHEVAEMVLAHGTLSEVEKAYLRKDFLTERTPIMENWAQFLASK